MRPRNPTEEEYKQMLVNMGKVGGGVSAPGLRVDQVTKGLTVRLGDGGRSATDNGTSLVSQRALQDGGSQVRNLAPPPQKREYDSKWEETFASELVLRKHAGLIKAYWYHPFSMWLPGKVRYTPDFMIEYPFGAELPLQIVEIKGWSKNLRDGMTRLKIAAAIFPCFTWTLVKKRKGGGWDEGDITP